MSETLVNKNYKCKFVLIVSWACVQTYRNSIVDNCNDESNDNDVIDIDNNDDNNNNDNSEENYS